MTTDVSPARRLNLLQTFQVLHVAQEDLHQAYFFANHLLQKGWHRHPWEGRQRGRMHQAAYMSAMVVAYGRAVGERRGYPRFPGKLLKFDGGLATCHSRLLALRDSVYAHSDLETWDPNPTMMGEIPIVIERLPEMRMSAEDLGTVLQLFRELAGRVRVRKAEIRDVLDTQCVLGGAQHGRA